MQSNSYIILYPVPECVGEQGDCPTCCCSSSDNVDFYDKSDPACTAPPAIYHITFTYTLTETCHPDVYTNTSSWSPLTARSHSSDHRMWDACMDSVTSGVATFSQTGDISGIRNEAIQAATVTFAVIDATFDGDAIPYGSGTSSTYLTFDKDHQYVSALTRLIPSPDYVVGVADLNLCDGDKWKESVKVCFELFSTATASDRVAPENRMNSVQGYNCSFGFAEFNFNKVQVYIQCSYYRQGVVMLGITMHSIYCASGFTDGYSVHTVKTR